MGDVHHSETSEAWRRSRELFDLVRKKKGSVLHLSAGEHPVFKARGILHEMSEYPVWTVRDIEDLVLPMLTPEQRQDFAMQKDVELAYRAADGGHVRFNLYTKHNGIGLACRIISVGIPSFKELGNADILEKIASYDQGLIIVTGAPNSGKTTTLASFIDHINTHRRQSIVTLENTIEFFHARKSSLIEQRQVGLHTKDFLSGIRSALRSDMDVLLIDEVDSSQTMTAALEAAESQLVFMAYSAFGGAAWTIRKILGSLPQEQEELSLDQLSRSLRAVIWQHLLPREHGEGRRPVMEIMLNKDKIAALLRQRAFSDIHQEIERDHEMRTMKQSASALGESVDMTSELIEIAEFGAKLLAFAL
jgi:twitching motility protein PilT